MKKDAETQEIQKGRIPDPPPGYKVKPLYIEKKSKRLQLVLKPSLYERVKKAASEAGLSVNEYASRVLDKATEEG